MQTDKEAESRVHLDIDEDTFMGMLENVTKERDCFAVQCEKQSQELQEGKNQILLQEDELKTYKKKKKSYKRRIAVLIILLIICIARGRHDHTKMKEYKEAYLSEQAKYMEIEEQLMQKQADYDKVQADFGKVKKDYESMKTDYDTVQANYDQVKGDYDKIAVDYDRFQSIKNSYDRLIELEGQYGYGSEDYYSDTSFVAIHKGETKKVNIYTNISTSFVMSGPDKGIGYEWGKKDSDGKYEVKIAAESAGVYTLLFTNKKNSDAFKILVVVYE